MLRSEYTRACETHREIQVNWNKKKWIWWVQRQSVCLRNEEREKNYEILSSYRRIQCMCRSHRYGTNGTNVYSVLPNVALYGFASWCAYYYVFSAHFFRVSFFGFFSPRNLLATREVTLDLRMNIWWAWSGCGNGFFSLSSLAAHGNTIWWNGKISLTHIIIDGESASESLNTPISFRHINTRWHNEILCISRRRQCIIQSFFRFVSKRTRNQFHFVVRCSGGASHAKMVGKK